MVILPCTTTNIPHELLLNSLQKDIVQVNTNVHHLSKELKALTSDRNFYIIMFQLRSHLATLHNGINSLRIDILPIIYQISAIHLQKLTPALLNPLALISLFIKLETKLISHPRLTLPAWHSGNIWCMYKFIKLQSFMMSDTLYAVLHIPFFDRSLQFQLFRIYNVPLVHPTLQSHFSTLFKRNTLPSDQMDSIFYSHLVQT